MFNIKDDTALPLSVLISGDEEQRHVGFYIRDNADPELIHLAWHLKLCNHTAAYYSSRIGSFSILECENFSEHQIEDLVSFVKTVWRKNQNLVQYGIGSNGFSNFFDSDHSANRELGEGLTCATFVMTVFASQHFPIIDELSWSARESDKQWQEDVLEKLVCHDSGLREHVAAQRQYVGESFRFRPEEVAACASLYQRSPVSFDEAVRGGEQLLELARTVGFLKPDLSATKVV
ncbi:hypothetical protein NRB16_03990 [Pseudomonas sp. LJDD11]|uniref:hypothetical protein n=1 Tax=Pseudomonas sp. LJDD11 TaxID=2931984 RepID=UPI00211C04B7|nr:hypothetical protein [Pseudomonas sp. LJDD11]MCQ9422692.1 hypothetical protein [Pseudomonas sp. LJDD11]